MGQIRKIGDVYYIEFHARGLVYSQIGGASEEEAQRLLIEIEAKIEQGEGLTTVREIDLLAFFEKFLTYAEDKFSPISIERFRRCGAHWIKFIHNTYPHIQRISQVTPAVIESYKTSLVKEEKAKVVNFTLLLLREILEYGIRIGFINDNPSLHITLIPLPFRNMKQGRRSEVAKDLFSRSIPLEKIYAILKLSDIAQVMYWSNFIPLKREDVYN